jgi:hypothetical protein
MPGLEDRPGGVDPEIWESTCDIQDRVEQIGVVAFRAMTLAALGGGEGAIWACSHFEHEEGRAWDWMNDAANPEDAARVEAMLHWLLAPDEFGRPNEMARRLGLAYMAPGADQLVHHETHAVSVGAEATVHRG